MRKFFLKDPSNWKFWLLLGFIAKSIFFLYRILQSHEPHYLEGFWGRDWGDTWWYLNPIDNLLKTGHYTPDFRMPGYGAIYLPFKFFFSSATAYNLLIVFQLLLASISVYVLALIAKSLVKNNTFFYLTFYLFAISTYSNVTDTILMTESLTASLLVFTVYFFIKYFTQYKKTVLLFSGFLLAWVVFLRPVYALVIAFFFLILLADCIRNKKKIVVTLLFLLPFTVFDSLWIAHNYSAHKKFIPLSTMQPEGTEDEYFYSSLFFVKAWGGDLCFWEPTSEIRWFCINWAYRFADQTPADVKVTIPDYIYTSKFNKDSLLYLRKILIQLGDKDSTISADQRKKLNRYAAQKFNLYAQSIKEEKPFLYYVRAPLKLLKTFILDGNECRSVHWPTNLIPELSKKYYYFDYSLEIFYSIFYFATMAFGCFGILLLSKSIFKLSALAVVPVIPAYVLFIHPVVLHYAEGRHLIESYPLMLLCAIYAGYWLIAKIKKTGTISV